jgi:serine/threonine protein kinase
MPMFRVGGSGAVSEMSDVYSFGVFLLELMTGKEALHIDSLGSNESLFLWVCKMLFVFHSFSR